MSKIILKSDREIKYMKEAGEIMKELFLYLKEITRPGLHTKEIDLLVKEFVEQRGGRCATYNYEGFPGHLCISINDTLLHGIPSKKIKLKDGDIVSYDVVIEKNGYMVDACRTFPVGNVKEETLRLIKVTEESFFEGVKHCLPGKHLGDISHAIGKYVKDHGYSVTLDFSGHGIGSDMHEDPSILNDGKEGVGVILKKGMCLAIEPMVIDGKSDTYIKEDGWTVKTLDKSMCSHYENTVVVTSDSYEIITL